MTTTSPRQTCMMRAHEHGRPCGATMTDLNSYTDVASGVRTRILGRTPIYVCPVCDGITREGRALIPTWDTAVINDHHAPDRSGHTCAPKKCGP